MGIIAIFLLAIVALILIIYFLKKSIKTKNSNVDLDNMKKTFLLLSSFFTLCVVIVCTLLVGYFIYLNFDYILNPETSPGYSNGTPFGDGYDLWWNPGINLPITLLVCLILFNGISFVIHFCSFPKRQYVFILASIIFFLIVIAVTLVDISILSEFFSLVSFFLMLPELLLVPALIVCSIVFFVSKKKLIAGHITLLTLCMMTSCALEWFSCYLYLD